MDSRHTRAGLASKLSDAAIILVLLMVCVVTLYPFLNILAISLNDSQDSVRGNIYLWPRVFTLANYQEIFKNPNLSAAFGMSVLRTVVGTLFSLVSTAIVAYVISRKDFVLSKLMYWMFLITMYVGGGMIPEFLLVRSLGLTNNFWVYIFPGLIGGWNVFVTKSFMDGLPSSLQESAKLDGANDMVIFARIILPLCAPVLATIALFYAVYQWNSWFDTYIYAGSRVNLTTLQYELMKIITSSNSSAAMMGYGDKIGQVKSVSPESIRMAITIVATAPILCVYPFLQKYFVKGLTLGAVKS